MFASIVMGIKSFAATVALPDQSTQQFNSISKVLANPYLFNHIIKYLNPLARDSIEHSSIGAEDLLAINALGMVNKEISSIVYTQIQRLNEDNLYQAWINWKSNRSPVAIYRAHTAFERFIGYISSLFNNRYLLQNIQDVHANNIYYSSLFSLTYHMPGNYYLENNNRWNSEMRKFAERCCWYLGGYDFWIGGDEGALTLDALKIDTEIQPSAASGNKKAQETLALLTAWKPYLGKAYLPLPEQVDYEKVTTEELLESLRYGIEAVNFEGPSALPRVTQHELGLRQLIIHAFLSNRLEFVQQVMLDPTVNPMARQVYINTLFDTLGRRDELLFFEALTPTVSVLEDWLLPLKPHNLQDLYKMLKFCQTARLPLPLGLDQIAYWYFGTNPLPNKSFNFYQRVMSNHPANIVKAIKWDHNIYNHLGIFRAHWLDTKVRENMLALGTDLEPSQIKQAAILNLRGGNFESALEFYRRYCDIPHITLDDEDKLYMAVCLCLNAQHENSYYAEANTIYPKHIKGSMVETENNLLNIIKSRALEAFYYEQLNPHTVPSASILFEFYFEHAKPPYKLNDVLQAARCIASAENFELAKKLYDEYFTLVNILKSQNKLSEAYIIDLEDLINAVNANFQTNNYAQAIKICEQFFDMPSTSIDLQIIKLYAASQFKLSHYEKAIEFYERVNFDEVDAHRIEETDIKHAEQLANCYRYLGFYEKALRTYKRVAELYEHIVINKGESASADEISRVAFAYKRATQFEKAVSFYERYIDKIGTQENAYSIIQNIIDAAICYQQLGNNLRAAELYSDIVVRKSDSVDIIDLARTAGAYIDAMQYEKAHHFSDRYLTRYNIKNRWDGSTRDPSIRAENAELRFKIARFLESVLENKKDTVTAQDILNVADAYYFVLKDYGVISTAFATSYKKATEFYEKYLHKIGEASDTKYVERIAYSYYKNENYKKAAFFYEKYLDKVGGIVSKHIIKAAAYSQLKAENYIRANELYRKYFSFEDPSSTNNIEDIKWAAFASGMAANHTGVKAFWEGAAYLYDIFLTRCGFGNDAQILVMAGWCNIQIENYSRAAILYDQAFKTLSPSLLEPEELQELILANIMINNVENGWVLFKHFLSHDNQIQLLEYLKNLIERHKSKGDTVKVNELTLALKEFNNRLNGTARSISQWFKW